jgi:hypothetical protein
MGTAHLTDAIQGLTVAVWDGDVSAAEWREHLDSVVGDTDLPACRLFLADIRGAADVSSIDDTHLDAMASRFAGAAPLGSRVAIVASNLFHGAQSYQSYTTSWGVETAVFLDLASACSWLRVDLETANLAIMRVRSHIHAAQ